MHFLPVPLYLQHAIKEYYLARPFLSAASQTYVLRPYYVDYWDSVVSERATVGSLVRHIIGWFEFDGCVSVHSVRWPYGLAWMRDGWMDGWEGSGGGNRNTTPGVFEGRVRGKGRMIHFHFARLHNNIRFPGGVVSFTYTMIYLSITVIICHGFLSQHRERHRET